MRNVTTPLLVLFLLLSLCFCSAPEADEMLPEPAAVEKTSKAEIQSPTQTPETSAKVVRTATLRFQVEKLVNSTQRVEDRLKQYQAFVFNSNHTNSPEAITMDYTIKVAPAQLEPLLKELQRESIHLDVLQLSSTDVSAEYVDVAARIKTKQAVEQRYTDLLNKATKISEILTIEDEIKKVREEREAMQARLNALEQETTYSTINLSMYQQLPMVLSDDEPSFLTEALVAVNSGWELCRNLFIGMLYIWPLWLLGLVAYWFYRRYSQQKSTLP